MLRGNSGTSKTFLLRYLSNGTVDESFGNEGYTIYTYKELSFINSVHLQSNGKIITVPTLGLNNIGYGSTRRYNADGTFDKSFTQTSYATSASLKKLYILPDDKILVLENAESHASLGRNNNDVVVKRLNADGTLDTGFGIGGSVTVDVTTYSNDYGVGLTVQPDGQILVGAGTGVESNRSSIRGGYYSLIRLSANGAINGKIINGKNRYLR